MSRAEYAIEMPGAAYAPPGTFASRTAAIARLRRWWSVERVYLLGPCESERETRDADSGEYRSEPIAIWYAYRSRSERDADLEGAYAARIVRTRAEVRP